MFRPLGSTNVGFDACIPNAHAFYDLGKSETQWFTLYQSLAHTRGSEGVCKTDHVDETLDVP